MKKSIMVALLAVFFGQTAFAKTVEGAAKFSGQTVDTSNHDATLKAYELGSKFVTILAKEEVERICRDVEKGTIKPETMLCLDNCEIKPDPYGSFFSGILTCHAKCRVDCEMNKE